MSDASLPCIVCGVYLRNVTVESENQPSGGVAFHSPGHYGSTVWDPMDGEFLEFNICDDCLVEAGKRGSVLAGRARRPVVVEGLQVGWEELDRPMVEWQCRLPGYGANDVCVLDVGDLDRLPRTIHLDITRDEIISAVGAHLAEEAFE